MNDPGAAQALREFLAYLGAEQEPTAESQSQHVQGGSTVVGDVSGNAGNINIGSAGDVNIGSGKIRKRRRRSFLPFIFFNHAVKPGGAYASIEDLISRIPSGAADDGGTPSVRSGETDPERYLKGQCPDSVRTGEPFSVLASIVPGRSRQGPTESLSRGSWRQGHPARAACAWPAGAQRPAPSRARAARRRLRAGDVRSQG